MTKPNRIIFQPDEITDFLIRGYSASTGGTTGDIINAAVYSFFIPRNLELAQEVEPILIAIKEKKGISDRELQATLARCVSVLKEYPISDYGPINEIMYRFRTNKGRVPRYDYILIVDDHTDSELRRLNEVIKSVDSEFNLGMHELGERTRSIFANWTVLCGYREIYEHIATIILHEKIYMDLNIYDVLCMVKALDDSIFRSPAKKIADEYPVQLTLEEKISGLKYEILSYLTDSGYVALTGDTEFNFPNEMREYYRDLDQTVRESRDFEKGHLEEYYKDLIRLKEKGERLFRTLSRKNKNRM